ncbi:unnamed protein product [Parascedosporium putredinis]|uniref:Uncharacterized protein n=1 Tax=Parascedosporium putredinis TaxID=1442378 RepID=A0A9P1MAU4_9PEZI|nr:unnamed protein product [Parascedosporium putredinis]CAI7998301.1 unnamed protein product [Parascedosporium putredinis]
MYSQLHSAFPRKALIFEFEWRLALESSRDAHSRPELAQPRKDAHGKESEEDGALNWNGMVGKRRERTNAAQRSTVNG